MAGHRTLPWQSPGAAGTEVTFLTVCPRGHEPPCPLRPRTPVTQPRAPAVTQDASPQGPGRVRTPGTRIPPPPAAGIKVTLGRVLGERKLIFEKFLACCSPKKKFYYNF